MDLQNLLRQGKLKHHKTSKQEIEDLLSLVERDLKDAHIKELSADRRFATAYNACLQLATIILHCKGYRSGSGEHHFISFQFLKTLPSRKFKFFADYFDYCRMKRNSIDYKRIGMTSETEVRDILKVAHEFLELVEHWLVKNMPAFKLI